VWQDIKLLNASANALFGIALTALLLSGIWWVIQRPIFTLKTIRVDGVEQLALKHVNVLTIREAALPKLSGNFLPSISIRCVRHLRRCLGE